MNLIGRISEIKNNEGVMKYFKNTSWLVGEKLLRLTISLFVGVWVTRFLGPEKFGIFSYSQSVVTLFAAFSMLGLDSIVVKELVKNNFEKEKILGTAFCLKLIGSLLVIIVLALYVFILSKDYENDKYIFVIALSTMFQSMNVIDFYFQSKVLSKYVVYCNAFTLFISSMLKIIFIFCDLELMYFVVVLIVDSALLALGYVYFYSKIEKNIASWVFEFKIAKHLLKNSWSLILTTLVVTMYMKIDQIMINELLGSIEVGVYAAAVRLSEVWYFIPVVISSSLFPAILNAKKVSEKLYLERMQKLYVLMFFLGLIIALPMTFLSNFVITLLYGDTYIAAADVLMIHIWSSIFVFFGVASSNWFVTEGLQRYSFYRTLAGLIVNITLNYILIPLYGILGAAIATLISQIFASFLFNIVNKLSRPTFILQCKAISYPFLVFIRLFNK